MNVGIAVGATSIIVPEVPFDFERDIIDRMRTTSATGKKHFIVIVAEGVGHVMSMAEDIEKLAQPDLRSQVTKALHELGFLYVALDLDGYTAGNLNKGLDGYAGI